MRSIIIFLAFMASSASAQGIGSRCTATAAEFGRIRTGMSLWEVALIIGCQGVTLSETSMGGTTSQMIAWDGEGSLGANMNVLFQNSRVISKSQFGLR